MATKKKGMNSKFFNIIVFDEIEAKPKKYKLSKRLLKSSIYTTFLFLIAAATFLTYFINNYNSISKKIVSYNKLKSQNAGQKVQIEKFAKKIEKFETKILKLDNFERKLRAMTSMSTPQANQKEAEKWSVGGPNMGGIEKIVEIMSKDSNAVFDSLVEDIRILDKDLDGEIVRFEELNNYLKNQSTILSSVPTIWPIKGWVTSSFGYRRSAFTSLREIHEGIDIAANFGSKVVAPADGIIIRSTTENGYGNLVEIDHGYGYITKFGHNSKNFVNVGDKVKRGQKIAAVGSTGRSTGPHVHYEIILNGVPVDPLKYIIDE